MVQTGSLESTYDQRLGGGGEGQTQLSWEAVVLFAEMAGVARGTKVILERDGEET